VVPGDSGCEEQAVLLFDEADPIASRAILRLCNPPSLTIRRHCSVICRTNIAEEKPQGKPFMVLIVLAGCQNQLTETVKPAGFLRPWIRQRRQD
jgi:hypothetical protein